MDMELDRIFAILLLVIGAYYIVSANTIRRDKKIRPGDNRHVAPSRINDLDGYCNWVAKWFYILAAVTWFDSAVFFFNIFVRESALLCVIGTILLLIVVIAQRRSFKNNTKKFYGPIK
jgi:hypothetical protein